MVAFQTILCPVDFSDCSRAALRYALALAGLHDATLIIVYVNDPLLAEAAAVTCDVAALDQQTENELKDLTAALLPGAPAWTPPTRFAIRTGKPEEEILELADEEQAGLIVLGTHGLGGYRKMFFGSTAERVLRDTRVPVLVVPKMERDLIALQPEGPVLRIDRIVVPVDFSAASAIQARTSGELARAFRVPLLLVHIAAPSQGAPPWQAQRAAEDRRRTERAREQLATLAASIGDDVAVEAVVSTGRPGDEIARLAIDRGAGLIVMGLRSESDPAGPRTGSIAYRVLTLAPVPVLALPALRLPADR